MVSGVSKGRFCNREGLRFFYSLPNCQDGSSGPEVGVGAFWDGGDDLESKLNCFSLAIKFHLSAFGQDIGIPMSAPFSSNAYL